MDDPVLLALPPALAARHGLEPGQSADLTRFADENWLMPGPETSCHELIKRACGAAGFVPHPIAVASDFSVLTALVAAEAGIVLVPGMAMPADRQGVSLHPLVNTVTRTVSAFTRISDVRQPHLNRVLDSIRTVSADIHGPAIQDARSPDDGRALPAHVGCLHDGGGADRH